MFIIYLNVLLGERFYFIMFIGNEMGVYTSRFANVWSQIKQIGHMNFFTHLKLRVAVAIHNFN